MQMSKASIADYTKALAINPKIASSLYVRGLAEQRMGRTVAAKIDYCAAKEIDARIGNNFARRYKGRLALKLVKGQLQSNSTKRLHGSSMPTPT